MDIDGKKEQRIKVAGKFSFNKLPIKMQESIKDRIAKKDPIIAKGLLGKLPGIKIDGKSVTKDNIKDFEKKEIKKFSKEDLNKLDFKELKVIGKKLGTTDRSRKELIKEILNLQ